MNNFSISVLIIFIGTVLSKVLGFLRDVALTYKFGASTVSDAYIIATTIPTVFFGGVGMAVLTSFIPIYSRIDQDSIQEKNWFTSNLITIIWVIGILIIGIYYVFPEEIIKIFAFGFDQENIDRTKTISNIAIFSVLFIGIWYIMKALLQVNDKFALTAFSSLPLNICIIIGILLSDVDKLMWMGAGFLCGYILAALWGYIAATQTNFRFRIRNIFKDSNLNALLIMAIPVFFSQMLMQINIVIDRTLASTLAPGIVSSLSYANRLNDFLASLFIASIGVVAFPAISKMTAQEEYKRVGATFDFAVHRMLLLIFPATVGLIVLSKPVITLLFGRGAFTAQNIEVTSIALICYVVSMPFYCYNYMGIRMLFAMKNAKTPMVNSSIAVVTNIILNFVFIRWWGYKGLAIATTTSIALSSVLILMSVRRRNRNISFRNNLKISLSMMLVALFMGIIVFFMNNFLIQLNLSNSIALAISIFTGIFIYFGIIYILNINSMRGIINSYLRVLHID